MTVPKAHSIIQLPVTPIGKPRMTQRDKWKARPAIQAYHTYCDELRLRMPGYELPIQLRTIFYLPMPDSWSQAKKREKIGTPHDQKPDIDNLAKGFMDAFKTEDKHVAFLHAEKYWAREGGIIVYEGDV